VQEVTPVGIDLGKHSFHLHGQDRHGKALFRGKVGRKQLVECFATLQPCTVVMAACAGAHYMARKRATFGYNVKLISPQFVRPFVKSNKNDFVDAEAICEAASRPSMRFVTPKTESQQTLSALHRVRESLVRDRVKTSNQMHGFLLEFGISLPVGRAVITHLCTVLVEHTLPPRLVAILEHLHAHFKYLSEQISAIERELVRQLDDDDLGQRLLSIPGVGPITASVLASEMGDGRQYGSTAGTLPHRSDWCPASTALAARPACSESASRETRISDDYLSSAPTSTCSDSIVKADRSPLGSVRCWGDGSQM
jgi:transposase